MDRADAVEAFNALNIDRLSNMAAERRARKRGLSMVAGSDAHSLSAIGTACNFIDADSVDGVLAAIRRGRVSFRKKYIPMDMMKEWVRERLVQSYAQVLSYIDIHYSGPKRWLAKSLLNDYVVSGRRGWEKFSGLGLALVTGYSALRLAAYY
jgi:hypothetical protein